MNRCQDEINKYELKLINPSSEPERDLMLKLAAFNVVVEKVFYDKAPNKICEYIYDLANLFNRFYHDNRIITEENLDKKMCWIKLITMTKSILEISLELLGLEAPDKM